MNVRAAVPLLIASYLQGGWRIAAPAAVTDVVVNDDEALAAWSDGGLSGISGLTRRYGRWWLTGQIAESQTSQGIPLWVRFANSSQVAGCVGAYAFQATPNALIAEMHISAASAALALQHIPAVAADVSAHAAWRAAHPTSLVPPEAVPDCYSVYPITSYQDYSGGYRAELAWGSPAALDIARFTGRAPTRAEFPGEPGADAIYFFSLDIGGSDAAHVTGATLDVWCPFVLDTNARYSLTLVGGEPTIGPIDGTLRDNTLHFELPPFTATPGTSLMGEVDRT